MALKCLIALLGPESAPPDAAPAPASVVARYAILRRAQAPSDVPPSTADVGKAVSSVLASFDPAETRLLATLDGASVYLVVGTTLQYEPLPASCLRDRHLRAFAPVIAAERRLVGSGPGYALVEVASVNGTALNNQFNGGSFAANAYGFQFYAQETNAREMLVGLVPDGVGAVKLAYSTSPAVTFPVQGNVASGPEPAVANSSQGLSALFGTPKAARRFLSKVIPQAIAWLSAPGGSTVAAFARPAHYVEDVATVEQIGLLLALLKAGPTLKLP